MRAHVILLALVGCSIPDTQFHASNDAPMQDAIDAPPDMAMTGAFVVDKNMMMITEGTDGTFTVHLAQQPESVVTAMVTETSPAVSVTPTSFDFTPTNWNEPVEITVTPMIDTNDVAEMSTVSIEATGLPAGTVSIKTLDPTVVATIGWPPTPTAFSGTSNFVAGGLAAFKITITADATLDKLGVFIPAASGFYRMALYSDLGDTPDVLVAQFGKSAMVNGANVFDLIPDAPISTATTQSFWIVIRTTTTVGISSSPTAMGRLCARQQSIPNIDDAWPSPFGQANCGDAALRNVWIETYHQ